MKYQENYRDKYLPGKSKFKTNKVEFLKQNKIFNVEYSDEITNPHNELAIFRAYYEWQLINSYGMYTKTGYSKIIIDVGASTRLYNSLVATVALRPILDSSDVDRSTKLVDNYINHISELTIQEFLDTKYYEDHHNKMLFNFTDVLYYIPDTVLKKIAEKQPINKVFGIATMHIIDNKQNEEYVHAPNKLGIVLSNHIVLMSVSGNNTTYYHPARFPELLKSNQTIIKIDANTLILISVNQRVKLVATDYVQLVLSKVENINMSKTIDIMYNEDYDDDNSHENEIDINGNIIKMDNKLISFYTKVIIDNVTSLKEVTELQLDDKKLMSIVRYILEKDHDTVENIIHKIYYVKNNTMNIKKMFMERNEQ